MGKRKPGPRPAVVGTCTLSPNNMENHDDLLLFSTDPPAGLGLRAKAVRHRYYIVSSTMRPPAMVVDPTGRAIVRTAADREVVVARFDLDYRILPSRFSWTRGEEIKEKYGDRIVQDWSNEGWCTLLTSADPGLPVGKVVEDEGLETVEAFRTRNIATQDAARGGPPGPPGAPLRSPWQSPQPFAWAPGPANQEVHPPARGDCDTRWKVARGHRATRPVSGRLDGAQAQPGRALTRSGSA